MDWSIVLDQHDRFGRSARHGAVKPIELLEMRDEISTAFGWAGVDDELARHVIEGTQDGDFLGLPWRRHPQIGTRFRPGAREIRMCQRLTFVTVKKNDIASFGLTLT